MPEDAVNEPDSQTEPRPPGPLAHAGSETTYLFVTDAPKKSEIWTEAELAEHPSLISTNAMEPGITFALVAINVAIFVFMIVFGVSVSGDSLIPWGAGFGPLTTHGEWWRLVTAMFLHSGYVHLVMNMAILLGIGTFTEKLFGRASFLVLYLFAGIGGNLAGLAWHPASVAVGASGAIFGLYGGLFAFLLRQGKAVPPERVRALVKSGAIFVAVNLAYGLATTNVDVSAHVGGFVTGFLLGCGLSLPLTADRALRLRRSLVGGLAGSAIAMGLAFGMPAIDDLRPHLALLRTLDTESQTLFNQSVLALSARRTSIAEFTTAIDNQVLAPWQTERGRLAKARFAPQQQKIADSLVEYMSLRAEGWSLTKQGLESNNLRLIIEGSKKQMAAAGVLKKMTPADPRLRGGQPAPGVR